MNNSETFWMEIADYIHYSKGLSNLREEESSLLSEAVKQSGSKKEWKEIAAILINEEYK